jgi:hypothetical protein
MLPHVNELAHKIRKVTSRGTPSYQLGHYEMQGEKGKRRSVFKVDVHLGEHATPEGALTTWSEDLRRVRDIGKESKAEKLQAKLDRLQELMEGRSREEVDSKFDSN